MRIILLVAASLLAGCASQPAPGAPVAAVEPITAVPTVYVSRHMRKGDGDNPPLSAQGAADAARLADLLKGKGIAAIFITDTIRSRQTGEPLATALGLELQVYDPRDNAALARRAAAISGSILIVGHSNTVPAIVAALGGTPPDPMSEEDFGRVFAVERASGKTIESRL